MKLNLEKLRNILRNTLISVWEYVIPIWKISGVFRRIKSKEDLENFIQERSAHVTQTTLYGYLKTRMGHKFTLMVQDDEFSKSINLAKWNIYMVALADCTFYVFSYLISQKNLQKNNSKEIFLEIIEGEKKNGLSEEIYNKAKTEFSKRAESVDYKKYYLEDPFKESGLALFNWAPIADELKNLDKKIVLNSIKLKWNLIVEEFKKLTTNLKFS